MKWKATLQNNCNRLHKLLFLNKITNADCRLERDRLFQNSIMNIVLSPHLQLYAAVDMPGNTITLKYLLIVALINKGE